MLIKSRVDVWSLVLPTFSADEIKSEPQFYRADYDFARKHGGPITQTFLDVLDNTEQLTGSMLFDSRASMLKKGMFPCIPGWHHDFVDREGDPESGRLNYENPRYRTWHTMCLFGDPVSQTQFAVGDGEFYLPDDGSHYEKWHPVVQHKVDTGDLALIRAEIGRPITFDDRAWHQGVAADSSGWRFFLRATAIFDADFKFTHNQQWIKAENEIRTQTQVYANYKGW